MIRFEHSRRARGNPPEFTLERVFGTTDVKTINALSEDDFQDALERGKAAVDGYRRGRASLPIITKSHSEKPPEPPRSKVLA